MDRETLLRLADDCERAAAEAFRRIDRTSAAVTAKVMEAFRRNRLSASHFAGGSGYGYDDMGRDLCDRLFADCMDAEAGFARHSITSGTHAIAIGLYALRAGKDPKDNAAVDSLLPQIELRLASIAGEQHIYLKDEDVSTAIRTEAAGMAASAVGANPAVRAFLLDLQRSMAKKQDVLMDGRDIGTCVLPDAPGALPELVRQAQNVELDGVYSGFLGSPDQVSIIQRLYREYPSALRLVDPVMGDAGQMYPTYTPELCEAMGALAEGADVLMPNLTEASILTKRDYPGQDLDDAAVTELLDALLGLGAKNVVLKGIDHGDGKIINYVASAEKGAAEKVELVHDKLPYMIHGTGDAFASALCGAVMAGRGLAESARIAGEFVRHAMESTRNQPHFEERGVSFELDLGELTSLVK